MEMRDRRGNRHRERSRSPSWSTALHKHSVNRVIFAGGHSHLHRLQEAIAACEIEGVEAWLAADFIRTSIARRGFRRVRQPPDAGLSHDAGFVLGACSSKALIDRIGRARRADPHVRGCSCSSRIGIKLTSPGPIFFRQKRAGKNGRPFTMYKFRSMDTDAEMRQAELAAYNQMEGPVFKIDKDPRVTKFGKFLRRTSLDEFPQLFNVLKGEMSLVGPRPLPIYEVEQFASTAQRRRLSMKPGLTCLWQIERPQQDQELRRMGATRPALHRQLVAVARFRDSAARRFPVVLFGFGARYQKSASPAIPVAARRDRQPSSRTAPHVPRSPSRPTTVVTGGAGFLGSHLTDRLLAEGHRVIGIDNFITGNSANIEHLAGNEHYKFIKHDVSNYIFLPDEVDFIFHFASPASPIDYLEHPIPTLKVGSLGTHNALGLAKAKKATFLLASTSECYGDPLVHPQREDYWGNVNPIGPRGVYDEAKRFAEAMTMAYHRYHHVDTKIVRIFNTYGPRMRLRDGRVVPAFIGQALRGEPLTIFGDGSQTRSFCYCSDLIDGIFRLSQSDFHEPVNIGNPREMTIKQFAEEIIRITGTRSQIEYRPCRWTIPRCASPTSRGQRSVLQWEPRVDFDEGIRKTIDYFRTRLD